MKTPNRFSAASDSNLAALVAVFFVCVGLARLVGGEATGHNPWQAFLQAPGAGRFLLVGLAFLLLGVVSRVTRLFDRHRPWVEWLAQVAGVGLVASALARVQDAAAASLFHSLDPQGWLSTSCVVLWCLGVCLLAWREKIWPLWLSLSGLGWASVYLGSMVAGMYWSGALVTALLYLLCFVLSPLWFGGLALRLHRAGEVVEVAGGGEREGLRLGAFCAGWMALAFLLAGAAVLLDPSQTSPSRAWQIRLLSPGWFFTGRMALLTAALAGLGVAQCLVKDLPSSRQGWAQGCQQLGRLAFFIMALSNIQLLSVDVPYRWIDPNGLYWLTGLGIWALGMSWLSWRSRAYPRSSLILGALTGGLLGGVPVASMLGDQVLWTLCVFGGSMLAGPLWLFSLARHWRGRLASL